jgi:hypothetical protein
MKKSGFSLKQIHFKRVTAHKNCSNYSFDELLRFFVLGSLSRVGYIIGKHHINNKNAVTLGAKYSVPNGTVKLVCSTASTNILSLAGQFFRNL